MGKSYSRPEEIIVAQNGANDASHSSLEEKVQMYGIVIAIMIIFLIAIGAYFIFGRCNKNMKKWARKEMISVVSLGQVEKAGQQPATVQYA